MLHAPYRHLSTPPSSPSMQTLDSSPSSSPSSGPVEADDFAIPPIRLSPQHPFSGDYKRLKTRAWGKEERKRPAEDVDLAPTTPSKTRHRQTTRTNWLALDSGSEDEDETPRQLPYMPLRAPEQEEDYRQHTTWEDAISNVVDSGVGQVLLSGQGLDYIPPGIETLVNFVGLEATRPQASSPVRLTRTATAPAKASPSKVVKSSFGRARSEAAMGTIREELQLTLSNNNIATLPKELFSLEKLTVLILRHNYNITYIPPEICNLTGLRELSIGGNALKYLPSEILEMHIPVLNLVPNPFLRPETSNSEAKGRVLSPVAFVDGRAPSLAEICKRALIVMSHRAGVDQYMEDPMLHESVFGDEHGVPIQTVHMDSISPVLKQELSACIPGSIPPPPPNTTPLRRRTSAILSPLSYTAAPASHLITGVGHCPSPQHTEHPNRFHHSRNNVFVHHVVERVSWETSVAGNYFAEGIPVRWRGCSAGCLDFMDEPEIAEVPMTVKGVPELIEDPGELEIVF